ncbi:MAG: hypothetical protein MJ237_03690 [bacterium]|nr:hypothetical protein [bacterium]
MSDDLTIQNSRPSAIPYFTKGLATGAVIGIISPWGFMKPRYNSFADVVNEKQDTFEKHKKRASGERAEAYNKLTLIRDEYYNKNASIESNIKLITDNNKNFEWNKELELNAKGLLQKYDTVAQQLIDVKKQNQNKLVKHLKTKASDFGIDQSAINNLSEKELNQKAFDIISGNNQKYNELFKEDVAKLDTAIENYNKQYDLIHQKAKELGIKAERNYTEEAKNAIQNFENKRNNLLSECSDKVKDYISKPRKPNRILNGAVFGLFLASLFTIFRPKDEVIATSE